MRLKNYNEDLVLETAKIVLKDRPDIHPTRSFLLDVAAYALNRIPPKYITSDRGFTREFMQSAGGNGDEGHALLNVIELITLVNHAVDVVARRRRAPGRSRASRPRTAATGEKPGRLTYFYNMPHIFGRVVDARTRAPVISAEVTLWINDKLSVPAETGWRNPYLTHEQTKGYFSFWPQVEMGDAEGLRVEFRISFTHEGYRPYTFKKSMKVPGEMFVHDYIRGDKLLDIGTLEMEPV